LRSPSHDSRSDMPPSECHKGSLSEAYVLGELSGTERAAFEAHYFDCPICAADVQAAMAVADGARALAPARTRTLEIVPVLPAPEPRASVNLGRRDRTLAHGSWPWSARVLATGATLVAALAAAQALVIVPRLRGELALRDRPQAVNATSLAPATRGQPPQLALRPQDRSFAVAVGVSAGPHRVRLVGPNGPANVAVPWFAVPSPRSGEPLELMFPRAGLLPGRYLLEVSTEVGGGPAAVEAFPLVLQTAAAAVEPGAQKNPFAP
jgi:hypothetical protein